MSELLALLIASLGIFLLGLHLVSSGLQESASRTLRSLIRRSTSQVASQVAVGLAAGAVMQSTSAVTTVLGSMATSGLIKLEQAIPIVAFANVGTTALVFAGAIDIRTAVLFAVGFSGIAFSMLREFRWKALSSVVLGLALLLYGGDLLTAAASGVIQEQWLSTLLRSVGQSDAMALLLGTVASFLAQSTAAVALMTVALANAGLLAVSEAVMMVYGANLGSTLIRMMLTRGSTGTLRQVSRFQDLFKITATVTFVALFYVERISGAPLVVALVSAMTGRVALQLALTNLLFNGTIACAAAAFSERIVAVVQTRWPIGATESLSEPEYLNLNAASDPETAIDLLEKEQMRVLRRTRDYLSLLRTSTAPTERIDPAALHRSFQLLFGEIDHFQMAIVGHHLDGRTSERLGNAQAREKLVEMIEDSVQQLAVAIRGSRRSMRLDPVIENFVEALDFLLMFAGDAARTLETGRAEFLFELSSDRGEMMGSLRSMHLAPDQGLNAEERALLLRLTTLFERIVWMLQRYAELLIKTIGQSASSTISTDGGLASPDTPHSETYR